MKEIEAPIVCLQDTNLTERKFIQSNKFGQIATYMELEIIPGEWLLF